MKRLILAVVASLACGACAPTIMAAHQVGDKESATWIYLKTDKEKENGVFRCKETPEGKPVCTKASIQ